LREVLVTGASRMEGGFLEVLKATLIQPAGTEISKPLAGDFPNSTIELYREGNIESAAPRSRADSPFAAAESMPLFYPTRTPTSKRDFSGLDEAYTEATVPNKHLAVEKTQLLQHYLGMPEVGLQAEVTTALTPKESIVDDEETTGRTAPPATSTYGKSRHGRLRMQDMVVVKVAKSNRVPHRYIEAWGSETLEMGWKV
jgi:hypothetical protein